MASLKSCPGKRQYWTCDFTPELWRGCCSFNPCQGYFEQCRDEIKDLLVNDEGAWDPASGKLGWDGNKFVSDTTTRTSIRSPTTTLTSISVRTTVVAETSDVGPKITKTITATNGNAVETSTGNSPTALAEDTKSSAGVGVGAIVGAAVGGAFITLLAVGLVIFLLRRRRRKADSLAARDGYHPPMDQYGEQEKVQTHPKYNNAADISGYPAFAASELPGSPVPAYTSYSATPTDQGFQGNSAARSEVSRLERVQSPTLSQLEDDYGQGGRQRVVSDMSLASSLNNGHLSQRAS